MNQYRCEHRELICHKHEPCGFQEYGDEESEVIFCSYRSMQSEQNGVLDKLGMYLDEELKRASQFNAMRNLALLDVKRKIKELRQSKDGE